MQGVANHLAETNPVVVGGRSATTEGSFPRRLQRRRPFNEIGDRVGNLEAQAQAHFDRAGDPLQLRLQLTAMFIQESAKLAL
ncbi:hypothetical protein GALL_551950 [mine drainage metagenome]|uniref:Uncharacterized protein n=1 Tax=mine drainage metagenome TaxID=410659 RepID=A0A1J5NVN0_9ZZZZ